MRAELKEALTDAKAILVDAWRLAKRRWVWLVLIAIVVAGAVFVVYPHDRELYERITTDRVENLIKVSNKFRRWGDFRDTVTITLLVFAVGWVAKKRTWRTAAVGCFIAACVAGLMINAVRFTSGRPRPRTDMPDGFYGPTVDYEMQSFPSGHAGTSSGCGVSLAIALPAAGIFAFLSGAGVVWSCLYSGVHYVTDVLVGGTIGITMGILFGVVTRRRMKKLLEDSG